MSREIQLTGVRMFATGLPPHSSEHIEEVMGSGQSWTVAEVIVLIENGHQFFVEDSVGDKAYVQVIYPTGGLLRYGMKPYIKTRPDGVIADNLLALPGGPLHRGGLLACALMR